MNTTGGGLSLSTGALPTINVNISNTEHDAINRATIGAGSIVVRDITPANAAALLATLNRDPGKFFEMTRDVQDVLVAELNLKHQRG